MYIEVREFQKEDIKQAVDIWNEVVADGVAFPQMDFLNTETGMKFFGEQSFTALAWDTEKDMAAGLYILHPNNVGRCGHICNASYAVRKEMRGRHIGETLVTHCLMQAKALGFRILQFNAVVKSNCPAMELYKKLGFVPLGTIPGGFLMKDGTYEDIVPHYYVL